MRENSQPWNAVVVLCRWFVEIEARMCERPQRLLKNQAKKIPTKLT